MSLDWSWSVYDVPGSHLPWGRLHCSDHLKGPYGGVIYSHLKAALCYQSGVKDFIMHMSNGPIALDWSLADIGVTWEWLRAELGPT